jgi:hypothetical protein
MIPADYVIWKTTPTTHAFSLDELVGFEKVYRIRNGEALQGTWPDNVEFTMDPDFPHHLLPSDSLYNLHRFTIISSRTADILRKKDIEHLELLRVGIRNHKGRLHSEEYYILHPLCPIDCLDVAASQATFRKIKKDKVDTVQQLVLRPIEQELPRLIFRIQGMQNLLLLHRSLASELEGAGLSGMAWLELDQYPET